MKKLVAALSLLLLGACMHNPAPASDQPGATLRVENRSFSDMNVYVMRSSESVRLGTITGLSSKVFTIPGRILFGPTTLRFRADPIGSSRQPISEEITVSPGDEVTIMLPANS